MKRNQGRCGNRRGYVLFTMAASCIVLCAFTGLVCDLGYNQVTRRRAQAAADAGAQAAALEILSGDSDSIATAAKLDTKANGFEDGQNNVTVTVNHPPSSGSYSGKSSYAEVIISKNLSTSFMSILGFASTTVNVRAVGGSGGAGGCIYALNTTAQDDVLASGSAVINAGCGIVDESNNSKALETTGGGCISSTTSIQVVGNYNNGNHACNMVSTPQTGITSPGDPFAGKYPTPTPGSCTATNWSNAGTTLSPGTYCGGITISGTNVTASAGTYILYGGGLTVQGGGNLSGTGVTFFNTNNGTSYKPMTVSGGSGSQLSAPTSGTYEGLLFYQDPNLPSNFYSQKDAVTGTSATKFEGALYFKHTNLTYSGGSNNTAAYTLVIADTITFSGPSQFSADYSSLSTGSPIKTSAIVAE